MTRDDMVHTKLARQVGGAIACLLAAALLLGLTACGSGRAMEPDEPRPERPVVEDNSQNRPAPAEPDELEPAPPPDEDDEHDGFPEPDEELDEPPAVQQEFTQEEFDQLVEEVLEDIIKDGMTAMEQARAVFDYVHNNIRYINHADKDDWMKGAYLGLTTGRGDCYTFYAVSRALLTALDIDNLPVERVGGKTLHFWNLVNCGDGWYHFDTCPRSLKMPSFLSFMVTDQQIAEFTAMAGRNYYDFDGSLLPERAEEIVTKTRPVPRPPEEPEEDPDADPNADPDAEPTLPPEDLGVVGEPVGPINPTDPVDPAEPVTPPAEMEEPLPPVEDPTPSEDESPRILWVEPSAETGEESDLNEDGGETEAG